MKLYKTISNIFHNLRIRYKLFLAYFLVTVVPVSGIGYFSYTSSARLIEEQSLNIITQFQRSTIESINKRLESYVFLANTIYDNQKIQQLVSGKISDYYDEYNAVNSLLQPVLQALLNATGRGIYVALIRYSNNYNEIMQGNFEDTAMKGKDFDYLLEEKKQYYQIINLDRVKDRKWFKEITVNPERYTWDQVGVDKKYKYISLIREMKDYSDTQGEKIGLLRLTVRIADILGEEKFTEASEKGVNLIFDRNLSLLSVEKEKYDYYMENREIIDSFLKQPEGSTSLVLNDKIIVKGELSPDGWRIASIFPITKVTENISKIKNTILVYCFISFIFLLMVTFLLSTSFSRRIISVIKQMQMFKKDNFDDGIEEINKDEIGFLTSVFNDMARRIDTLIKDNFQANIDKKDAQLKALQAQINPHFLYNSMSAICRLAEFGETTDIINMVKALAKFYRMTLNNGRELIRIFDEIEQIKAYLEIYRIRKGEFFNVVYRIDESIFDYYIVKVILQPFIENIFEHAMNIRDNPVNILISAELSEEKIIFKIMDDGIGIRREKLERLLVEPSAVSNKGGYGIKNVDERIKLQFGMQYGVKIKSIYCAGTVVIITVPKYEVM